MSNALAEFLEALDMVKDLLKLESNYHYPPQPDERKAVRGLRGGATVLMVAAFEEFLRQLIDERLSDLTPHYVKPTYDFTKLPKEMQVHSIYRSLERAMKGPPFQKVGSKFDRISEIDRVCKIVINHTIDPVVFREAISNPSASHVETLFANIGINGIFNVIRRDFEKKWRKPIAHSYIKDKLDEIVQRRHVVAHTANVLAIGRADLNESVRFLKIVAELLDKEMSSHMRHVVSMFI